MGPSYLKRPISDLFFCTESPESHNINSKLQLLFKLVQILGPFCMNPLQLYSSNIAVIPLSNCSTVFGQVSHSSQQQQSAWILVSENIRQSLESLAELSAVKTEWRKKDTLDKVWLPWVLIYTTTEFQSPVAELELKRLLQRELTNSWIDLDIISISSETFIVAPNAIHKFSIYEVYHLQSELSVRDIRAPYPSHLDGDDLGSLVLSSISGRSSRRALNNGTVTVVLAGEKDIGQGHLKVTRQADGSIEFISGNGVEMLRDFQQALHFNVKGYETKEFGMQNERDGITGIGKEIYEGRADMSILQPNLIPWRFRYFRFLQPVHGERNYVYFQQPPSYVTRNIFKLPFKADAYGAIAVCFTLMLSSLIIMEKLTASRCEPSGGGSPTKEPQEYGILMLAILCMQGSFQVPKSRAMKTIILTGLVTALALNIIYSSLIVSALTLRINAVKSFKDFVSFGYTLLAHGTVVGVYNNMKQNTEEATKILRDSKSSYVNVTDAIQKVLEPESMYAFMVAMDVFNFNAKVYLNISDLEMCRISKLQFKHNAIKSAMIIQKNSPYKQMLHVKTILLFESGLRHLHLARYHGAVFPPCHNSEMEVKFLQLTFNDSKLTSVLMALGLLLSSGALCLEYLLSSSRSSVYNRQVLRGT